MNILRTGNKIPVQTGFFKNNMVDLLPALRFLSRLHNFWSFLFIFSLILVTIIYRRATHFTDSEMIGYYQKKCGWNSKSTKTKKYVTIYARFTMLENHFLWFTLGILLLWEYRNKTLIYNWHIKTMVLWKFWTTKRTQSTEKQA